MNPVLRFLLPPALVGLAFAATIVVGLAWRSNATAVALDVALFRAINGLSCGATPTSPAFSFMWNGFNHTAINYVALYGISVAYVLLRKRNQWPRLLFVGLSVASLGFISNLVIWHWAWGDRPFTSIDACIVYPDFKPIWSQYSSYPSGHARETASELVVLVVFWRRLWPAALLYAVLLGVSRVFIGVHFPSDVVAGTLLGAAIGGIAFLAYDTYAQPRRADPGV